MELQDERTFESGVSGVSGVPGDLGRWAKNTAHDFAPHRTDSPDIPEINPDNLDSKVIVKENFQ